MTVAQTTQLLQLMLNSALMLALALAWWGGVWLRYQGVIHAVHGRGRRVRREPGRRQGWPDHQLRVRHRLTHHSLLLMYYVLLALAASLLALGLRTLIWGDWLISLALVLFVAGVAGMLGSVALALLEFYQMSGPGAAIAVEAHRREHYPGRHSAPPLISESPLVPPVVPPVNPASRSPVSPLPRPGLAQPGRLRAGMNRGVG